jgi:hypothetical protein
MEHKHLDLDGLLQLSYGISCDVGDGTDVCDECRAAAERMIQQRRHPRVEDTLPEWFWLRQSRAIQEAALEPKRPRWVTVAAMAGVLAAALLAIQPRPPAPARISAEDERLWQKVSATVNRVEPQALAPMDLLWAQ